MSRDAFDPTLGYPASALWQEGSLKLVLEVHLYADGRRQFDEASNLLVAHERFTTTRPNSSYSREAWLAGAISKIVFPSAAHSRKTVAR
jgi:hypothetical protein